MTSSAAVKTTALSGRSFAAAVADGSATDDFSDAQQAQDAHDANVDDKPLFVTPEERNPMRLQAIREFQQRVALLAQKAKQGGLAASTSDSATTSTSHSKSTDHVKSAAKKAVVAITDPSGAKIPFPSTSSSSSSSASKASSSSFGSHPTTASSAAASNTKPKTVTFTKAQPTLVSISNDIPVSPGAAIGHSSPSTTDHGASGDALSPPASTSRTTKETALSEHAAAELRETVAKKLSSCFPATATTTTSATPSNALTVNSFISRLSKTPTPVVTKRPSNLSEEDYVLIQQLTAGGDAGIPSSALETTHANNASRPDTATDRDHSTISHPDTVLGAWICIPNTYYLKYENSLPDARHPLFNTLMQERTSTLEFMLEKQEACLRDTRAYLKFLRGIQKLHAEMESLASVSSAP